MLVAILSGDTLSSSVSGSGCCDLCALVGLWFCCFGGLFLLDCFFFFFFFLRPYRAVSRDAGCSSSYHHRAAGGSEPLQPWHSAGLGKLCWRTGMHVFCMFFPFVSSSFCNPLTGWEDQLLVSPLISIDIMAGWLFLLVPLSLSDHTLSAVVLFTREGMHSFYTHHLLLDLCRWSHRHTVWMPICVFSVSTRYCLFMPI